MTEESDFLLPTRGPLPAWLTRERPPLTATTAYLLRQRRAMDLLKAGQFAGALVLFEQFLVIEPAKVDWLFMKGVCLLELGDYQAALVPMNEAERLAPFDPEILLIKADALLELRELDQAGQELKKLLAGDPENSRGHYRLACWAALSGRPHQALNELRRLIEADSGVRTEATVEPAFAGLRRLPAFRKLIAAGQQRE